MIPVIIKNGLDDLELRKFIAAEKARIILSFVNQYHSKPMIKTASVNENSSTKSTKLSDIESSSSNASVNSIVNMFNSMLNTVNLKIGSENTMIELLHKMSKSDSNMSSLVTMFTSMLNTLNLKLGSENTMAELLNRLSKGDSDLNKQAAKKTGKERRDEIKIVSKHIKDSHYQVDISKDLITKDEKKMFMISCYARDAYLGRYLIKRNFFFTSDREEFADSAYDEIVTKMAAVKDRYYSGLIDVSAINTQFKRILDGIIAEIETEEDSIGTNVTR